MFAALQEPGFLLTERIPPELGCSSAFSYMGYVGWTEAFYHVWGL